MKFSGFGVDQRWCKFGHAFERHRSLIPGVGIKSFRACRRNCSFECVEEPVQALWPQSRTQSRTAMLAASWCTDENQPDDSIVGSVRDEAGLEPRQSEVIVSTKQSDDILVSRIY